MATFNKWMIMLLCYCWMYKGWKVYQKSDTLSSYLVFLSFLTPGPKARKQESYNYRLKWSRSILYCTWHQLFIGLSGFMAYFKPWKYYILQQIFEPVFQPFIMVTFVFIVQNYLCKCWAEGRVLVLYKMTLLGQSSCHVPFLYRNI